MKIEDIPNIDAVNALYALEHYARATHKMGRLTDEHRARIDKFIEKVNPVIEKLDDDARVEEMLDYLLTKQGV